MIDACRNCQAFGDLDACVALECSGHNWAFKTAWKERVEAIFLAQQNAAKADRVAQKLRAVTQGRAA